MLGGNKPLVRCPNCYHLAKLFLGKRASFREEGILDRSDEDEPAEGHA
jgi:hypothetical protein